MLVVLGLEYFELACGRTSFLPMKILAAGNIRSKVRVRNIISRVK